MMTQITNLHDIEKIVGNMLVKQSQLDRSRIANAITPRGVDLSKFVTENVKLSYDLHDVVIIFEVIATDVEGINFTEAETDNENSNIRENAAFQVRLTIYGNEALGMSKILKARIESEKVRMDLLDKGLYVIDVQQIESINEYLNETMWPRADFSFRIACEMSIAQVDDMPEIADVDDLYIETETE